MLVINKIGPTKVVRVELSNNEVLVKLVDGTELLYRRVKDEGLQKV